MIVKFVNMSATHVQASFSQQGFTLSCLQESCNINHCVLRAPECKVSSHDYLSAYCLNPQTQCILRGLVNSVYMSHCGDNKTGYIALCYMDLNNRRTGKDAAKPRALGLLGHSVNLTNDKSQIYISYHR